MGVVIEGYGNYQPDTILDNNQVIKENGLDSSDEWIRKNLGIERRAWAKPEVRLSDLAYEASKKALRVAGVGPDSLSRIILGTSTADHTNVSSAAKVQFLLGATCPAFDIVSACASYIFALDTAINNLKTEKDRILCIGADVKSRFVNKNDRKFLPIFGDGGGALVLAKREGTGGFSDIHLWTDGSYYEEMLNPAGGSAMPATLETVQKGLHATRMKKDGKMVTTQAAEFMSKMALEVCQLNSISIEDIDYIIPHHANGLIMSLILNNLGLPKEKLFSTIAHTGNLVSGSLPFALCNLLDRNLKKGARVLLVTLGAGVSGGAVIYEIPE
ncbi:MAG: 3-oxoacyl-[acyl-carrier-protein] synthase-3 [Flammeovirgaceae bacterium]|jgi:3-oxoacyl-[acyl-carrier-protein] synthase-3